MKFRLRGVFAGVTAQSNSISKAEELAALPLDERLQRRIVDGERAGLEADLDEALRERPALAIINETLLAGMKVVGDLFKIALWIAILGFAWWFFGPQLGIPFPF